MPTEREGLLVRNDRELTLHPGQTLPSKKKRQAPREEKQIPAILPGRLQTRLDVIRVGDHRVVTRNYAWQERDITTMLTMP